MLRGQMKKREDEGMSLSPNKEVNEARNIENKQFQAQRAQIKLQTNAHNAFKQDDECEWK